MGRLAVLALLVLAPSIAHASEPVPTTAPWFAPRVGPSHAPADFFHTPGTLFINFEGADMQSCNGSDWPVNNCSTIMSDTVLPYSGDAGARAAVVQTMANDVADFAITIVGERPVDDDEYDMVMVGNWEPPPEEGGFAGVAPTIDCYNQTRGETSFSLDLGSASIIAKIVGQEAAHVWGLEHVDSANDILFPTTGGAGDPSFEDTCHQIVILDGGIQPTEAACAEMHELNCPDQANFQNSYQDMMMIFGPSSPDMSAPTLEIVAPVEGEAFPSGSDVELQVRMLDNIAPPIFDVFASVDVDEKGEGLGDLRGPDLTLPITQLPDGEHLVRVDIEDQSGNEASAIVHFVIGDDAVLDDSGSGGGSDSDGEAGTSDGMTSAASQTGGGSDASATTEDGSATDSAAEDMSEKDGCGCRSGGPSPLAVLAVLLLGVSRRRPARPARPK